MERYTEDKFLQTELEMGISLDNPAFIELARNTLKTIQDLEIKSILDYGAGVGAYSKAAIELGYEVYSFDIYKAHIDYMISKIPKIKITDKLLNVDLLIYIETAEHMTDKEINKVINETKPNYILFSSTSQRVPEWDEVWGHINIKEQHEWDSFFKGYTKLRDNHLPTSWSKIYKRTI